MRILLCILIVVLAVQSIGQSTYFNNHYRLPGIAEHYGDVLVAADSTYILAGSFITDTSGYLVRTHDIEGEVMSEETVLPAIPGAYYIAWREMLASPTDSAYFIHAGASFAGDIQGYLIKYDQEFDTLWTRYYDLFPTGSSTYFHTGLVDGDHLILCAQSNTDDLTDFTAAMKLVKMDLEGNVIWEETLIDFVDWEVPIPYSIMEVNDGYVVSFSVVYVDSMTNGVFSSAIKTDFDGEIEWIYEGEVYEDPLSEYSNILLFNESGRLFLSAVNYAEELTPNSDWSYSRIYLRELDPLSGEAIQEWEYFADNELLHYHNEQMIESHDGQLMLVLSSPYQYTLPYLMKVDTLGNTLWMQQYDSGVEGIGTHILHDIAATPDGGYIMCGELVEEYASFQDKWSWVVKVDACGDVEWTDCGVVGLDDSETLTPLSRLQVFPNPANDRIHLESSEDLHGSTISFTDMSGRRLGDSFKFLNSSIDVRQLQEGLYLLIIQTENGEVFTLPFQIIR